MPFSKKKKMEKMQFMVPLGSACRRSVADIITVLIDVKSLEEHVGEG